MRSNSSRTFRRWIGLAALGITAVVAATLLIYSQLPDYRNAIAEQRSKAGTTVVDRNGEILRVFPDSKERYSTWRGVSEFPAILKNAVVAAEDQRFWYHPGFDPVALVRALYTNILRWRVVSGASTISQQVVRLIKPRPRTYTAKFIEALASMKLEWQLSKDEILELHLNLSPMGGSIRGAALASRIYFGKDVSRINVPEAAVLAALPRSPSRYSPRYTRGREQLVEEKDRILNRMADLGYIARSECNRSLGPTVRFENRSFPLEAPHLVDYVVASSREKKDLIKTTVNLELQHSLERVLRSHRDRLRRMGIDQAGALIVSTQGPELLAMVGSFGYSRVAQGFNNATIAKRGAGSTLKPFLYALALDRGYQSFSEIPDTVRSYSTPHGDYLPVNADRRSYGPVNVRSALGNSLNISAVKTARALGVEDFCRFLQRLGLVDENSSPAEDYGLGIAIGNIEVNLYQLVQAYAALAAAGRYRPLTVVAGQEALPTTAAFSPEAAYIISDILADPTARLLTFGNPSYFDFGFPVSIKTGTSSNYRDAWIVGYTSRHVVGIWAGNFNGRPNNGVTGSAACGPILKDIVRFLYGSAGPEPLRKPPSIREVSICSISGHLARPDCPFKTKDYVIGSAEIGKCNLEHGSKYRFLGGAYARWIHRREAEMGPGRFRLMEAPALALRSPWEMGIRSSRQRERVEKKSSLIEIVSPHEGDRFVLSPFHPNRISLRAVPRLAFKHVVWFINGVEIARTPPPYEFFWKPTRGRHIIHAVAPSKEAARVTIHVQ